MERQPEAQSLPPVDWSQPWFGPLRERIPAWTLNDEPAFQQLNQLALVLAGDRRKEGITSELPRFCPASELQPGLAYESHIARYRSVPTRNNLHDLFNGLVWLQQPALKWHMNRLQAQAIERDGIGAQRGSSRDALTLFDENGALWTQPHPALLGALQRRDWVALFVEHRHLWATQRFEIVGHALLEQLVTVPRKGLTAHVLVQDQPLEMSEADWGAKPFLPLPVLGIPSWWPAQEDPDFYKDSKVFRPLHPLKLPNKP